MCPAVSDLLVRRFALHYNNLLVVSRRALLSSSLALLAGCRPKASAFPGYAFVANEEGQGLAAVDLTRFTLSRRIPLEAGPTAVLVSPARKAVYALTPTSGTIHEIDPARLAVRRRVHLARTLTAMRLASDESALWVASSDPPQLVRLGLEQFQADVRIQLPAPPADLDLTADGQLGAVSHGAAGLVSLLDLKAGRVRQTVPVGEDMGTVRFSRTDSKTVLVADVGRRIVSVLEASTGAVITNLAMALKPEHFCFKSDGGELFVTGDGLDAVAIINTQYTQVTETALAGRAPGAMAVSRRPEYLFVTNPPSGDVTILDVETRKAIAVVSVGAEPGFVAMTPDDQYALVLNRRSGTMAVIRLALVVPRRAREAPLFTTIPVGSKPVSAAVIAV